jgi:hypothetical protein
MGERRAPNGWKKGRPERKREDWIGGESLAWIGGGSSMGGVSKN